MSSIKLQSVRQVPLAITSGSTVATFQSQASLSASSNVSNAESPSTIARAVLGLVQEAAYVGLTRARGTALTLDALAAARRRRNSRLPSPQSQTTLHSWSLQNELLALQVSRQPTSWGAATTSGAAKIRNLCDS
jgi:hypothetical protein